VQCNLLAKVTLLHIAGHKSVVGCGIPHLHSKIHVFLDAKNSFPPKRKYIYSRILPYKNFNFHLYPLGLNAIDYAWLLFKWHFSPSILCCCNSMHIYTVDFRRFRCNTVTTSGFSGWQSSLMQGARSANL
jgi:hypothetical protein